MDLVIHLGEGVVGGLILNVMPCVFPVLFFKVSSLIEHQDQPARERRLDAVAYLIGTLIAFAGFAALVVALRAAGKSLGWGMQMQNPAFVASLVALLFIFGLNSVGVFHINVAIGNAGGSGGRLSSVVDGALITLVSTPCSAPFLGGAAAAALARDAQWWETGLLFWSVGLGLALPILLLGFIPSLSRLLPRPGAWMETFKILVGFTLFGAAVWLYGTLQGQVTPESATDFLMVLVAVGLALWIKERITHSQLVGARRALAQLVVLGATVGFAFWYLHFERREATAAPVPLTAAPVTGAENVIPDTVQWTPFTEEVKAEALKRGQPVFVDFTANWCASCKVFEKTHINVHAIRKALAETGIMAAKADLTANEKLWDTLNALGRNGLPTYVIYLPDGERDLFPEGPPLGLEKRLRDVGARFPREKFKPVN
ncbi:MAG: thioredoxin family protein [bacterium]